MSTRLLFLVFVIYIISSISNCDAVIYAAPSELSNYYYTNNTNYLSQLENNSPDRLEYIGAHIIKNGFNTPVNLSILNSASDDFAPSFNKYENKLYFNSNRSGYSKFYISEVFFNNEYKNFSTPFLLKDPLNNTSKNISYITFIDSNTALLSDFARTNRGSFLNIHKSFIYRNSWSKTSLIEEIFDTSFNAHPTVSPNGEMLVFASTRKNKQDVDLWIAFKQQDGSWGMLSPIEELNSTGNEITPYFASDSLLIFSSDGFYGPGGYDLYYSIFSRGLWSKPLPLNEINTEFNESDAILLPDGTIIFSSDRVDGLGGLDLYYATPKKDSTEKSEEYNFNISSPITTIEITKFIKYNLTSENLAKYRADSIFYNFSPPVLQIDLDWNNNNLVIQNAKCVVNNDTFQINTQTKSFLYDLSNFSGDLFDADKIEIQAILSDINNKQFQEKLEINITSSEIKELLQHKINNRMYYRIFTSYEEDEDITAYISNNKEVLNTISLLSKNKSISIFSNKKLSDNFKNQISNFFKTNNLNIDNFNFGSDTNKNIIEIRIKVI